MARKKIKSTGLYAPGSKSLKRSIATWGDKFGIGLDVLIFVQVGWKFEQAIEAIALKHRRSPRYVADALALVRKIHKTKIWPEISKRERYATESRPISKAHRFLLNELESGPRDRNQLIKLALRSGITTRTLERAYTRVGLTAPGKRLSEWQLSDQYKEYLELSRQLSRSEK
jgi:hypothetical protein